MISKPIFKGIFLLLLFCASLTVRSQSNYDYHTDTLTYSQYLRANWEALYDSARIAEKQGVDFYYLHLRTAFAAYYTARYSQAVAYFNAAEQLQKGDVVVNEFHYLSALYGGQRLEMIKRYALLSEEAKERYIDPRRKVIETLTLEQGYNINSDYDELKNDELHAGYELYGERILLKSVNYTSLQMSHGLFPAVTLSHAIHFINLNKTQGVYGMEISGLPVEKSYDISTKQWQYSLNAEVNIKDFFFISPAFSYVNYQSDFNEITYNDTYAFTPKTIARHQEFYALMLNYVLPNIQFTLHANYFKGDHFERWQSGLGAKYYLTKDKKHYLSATYDMLNDNKDKIAYVWSAHYGFKTKSIYLEINHAAGDFRNYSESNGLIIYNTYENITSKSGCNISVPLFSEHLWFALYYRYLNYASFYAYVDDSLTLNKEKFTHNNHSITGGLTWYF